MKDSHFRVEVASLVIFLLYEVVLPRAGSINLVPARY